MKFLKVLMLAMTLSVAAFAEQKQTQYVRWTASIDTHAQFKDVLAHVSQETGYALSEKDFRLWEDRGLSTSRFQMWVQMEKGIPVAGQLIRVWSDLKSGDLIQAEAHVADPSHARSWITRSGLSLKVVQSQKSLSDATQAVLRSVKSKEDSKILGIKSQSTLWKDQDLVREVRIKARRGVHIVTYSFSRKQVTHHRYEEFPQAEFKVPAEVYPLYEETEGAIGTLLPRQQTFLTHLSQTVRVAQGNDYSALASKPYLETYLDNFFGSTPEGQAQGFWSMSQVRKDAEKVFLQLPVQKNTFSRGAVLDGKFATVSIHPDAFDKFTGVTLQKIPSPYVRYDWAVAPVSGPEDIWEMKPRSTFLGKPLTSYFDAQTRKAERLADHDPVAYLNAGFDEVQVYYAVNAFMESLGSMGFTDHEISTRPFHAFLYDPDISMQDNAYYTDDTINFTTYSSKSINYARDNSTIWHELGHGVMDRVMGDTIHLADTGGLSEGMADYLAALVVADKFEVDGIVLPGMDEFRIKNKMGFSLTNEVHDDGEAYGGAMHDMLTASVQKWGRNGLKKVTDLTLESMRLTRNHPGLTAQDWFEHMLFADSLGAKGVRAPGELRDLIVAALDGRNFSLTGLKSAVFHLMHEGTEVTSDAVGSRGQPIPVALSEADKKTFKVQVSLEQGEAYQFTFPVTVKVVLTKGPLQGAIDWTNEDQEPWEFVLNSEKDSVEIPLEVSGKCDYSNRDDGSCVDFAYIQIWNAGETKEAVAKKRFYIRVKK